MSSWGYVALAYVVVWGSLAAYGLLLARRITQSEKANSGLHDAVEETPTEEQDSAVCDAPPGH